MLSKEDVLHYLALPQKPSPEQMKQQVKAYLASLTLNEKDALVKEESPHTEYAYQIEFLRQVGFSPLEASWYAGVGLDTLEVRNLVARRTLTLRRSGRPYTATAYDLIKLEKATLKDMTDEQVLEELRNE